MLQHNFGEAKIAYQLAIDRQSTDNELYISISILLFSINQHVDALRCLAESIRQGNNGALSWINIGVLVICRLETTILEGDV